MRASLAPALLFCLFPIPALAQSGRVFDSLSLESKILGETRKYAVYLPPCYDRSDRSYPVLYLLHGMGDDQTGWIQFGEVQNIADREIIAGRATPMVIVMPDADTTRKGYYNSPDGAWRYEDFFFEELMPHAEQQHRIKPEKRYRAVAGLSMGGGGAFLLALHRPDLFSASCPLSAYCGPTSAEDVKRHSNRLGDESGATDEQLEAYFKRYSVLEQLASQPAEKISSVRWYIDCGDDDFLFEPNSLAHIAMRKANIPHEYRVRDGGHSWSYWRSALPEVLSFVSEGFHQP